MKFPSTKILIYKENNEQLTITTTCEDAFEVVGQLSFWGCKELTSDLIAAMIYRNKCYHIFVIIKTVHENYSMAVGNQLNNLWFFWLPKAPIALNSLDFCNI